ncbi:ATP-dependent Clp protease proteolytic subunit [Undibacterium sp. CY18W]|uniref:ATP-dependent Clp protease proteolytic subunit n=1 Tax=Undibacterium hunanense TaxID=2762292 RepID=A0ABR6ZPZ9_9BURK|nr:ATP-dependent Clp protease proteolytic subunit [Undibacterium hunanense]MBC3917669.1 ATP-dependent Clp protease proteolytic subunit [Undibacterium hunanense]
MRVVNLLILIILIGVSSTSMFRFVHNTPGFIGALVALCVWAAAYFLPWQALGQHTTPRQISRAKKFTIAGIILLGLTCIFLVVEGRLFAKTLVGLLIFSAPFVLNIIALNRRLLELEVAAIEDAPSAEYGVQAATEMSLANRINKDFSTEFSNEAEQRHSQNYFLRHWRGELPLSVAYWLNGVLIGNLLIGALIITLTRLSELADSSLRMISVIGLASYVLTGLAWSWAMVGVWRSASKHNRRGGSAGVALLVQASIVLSVIYLGQKVRDIVWPQMREYTLIAMGKDSMSKIDISASPKGDSLYLRGSFGEGSASKFAAELAKAGQIKFIVLNSQGGRLLEADKIASMVSERKLDTYVEGVCVSACTYVFLAGRDRAATVNAKIGFHQPSFPGLEGAALIAATNNMLNKYRSINLPESFVTKIGQTPASNMWYPSREEMIAARVITRTSLGGEANTSPFSSMSSKAEIALTLKNNTIWQGYEAHYPGKIDAVSDILWKMKLQGANDASMQNAVRKYMTTAFAELLKTVDDEHLDLFAQLMKDQMQAARQVSPQACGQLLKSELDVRHTLPPAIVDKEKQFLESALKSTPRSKVIKKQSRAFQTSLLQVTTRLSPEQLKIVGNPPAYANQPALQCDAMIALYQNILQLRPVERHIVLSGILQDN